MNKTHVRPTGSLKIAVIAGEHSGDALGGKLMTALRDQACETISFMGVGGEKMEANDLQSLFPMSDVSVMGPLAILSQLPRIVRRVYQAVDAVITAEPDVLVIIDSPEFTHPIAKRVRRRCPDIPIVNYVSPSVWAWRPGRAAKMRAYVDQLMGLLPFEPDVHARLGGPECTYVGHPLIEQRQRIADIDPGKLADRLALGRDKPILIVLPGSRATELGRLMQPFGAAIEYLLKADIKPQVLVPVVPGMRATFERAATDWPVTPHVLEGEDDKWAAFKLGDAALVASGTVTLELAIAGTPMVAAYMVDPLAAPFLRRMITAPTIVLANLVLGENVFPELIQEDCTGEGLGKAVQDLLLGGPALERQKAGLKRIPGLLALPSGTPSEAAADIVLRHARRGVRH